MIYFTVIDGEPQPGHRWENQAQLSKLICPPLCTPLRLVVGICEPEKQVSGSNQLASWTFLSVSPTGALGKNIEEP